MGTAIMHTVPDRVKPSFVIFELWALLTLSPERQSARMPKITNDGLAQTGTGMLYSCTLMATVGVMVKIQQNANFVLYSLFGDDTSPLPASGDASTLVIFLNSWFRTL